MSESILEQMCQATELEPYSMKQAIFDEIVAQMMEDLLAEGDA